MLKRLGKKAQSTAEYAILISLVVGAVVAMQVFVRRGVQGRIRDVVNHTGQGGDVGGTTFDFTGDQYEPYYVSSAAQSSTHSPVKEELKAGGEFDKTIQGEEVTRAARKQVIGWQGEEVTTPDLP